MEHAKIEIDGIYFLSGRTKVKIVKKSRYKIEVLFIEASKRTKIGLRKWVLPNQIRASRQIFDKQNHVIA